MGMRVSSKILCFQKKEGFYDDPIEVSISTEEENTSVRYTLDGSQPTVSRGQLYEGPCFPSQRRRPYER